MSPGRFSCPYSMAHTLRPGVAVDVFASFNSPTLPRRRRHGLPALKFQPDQTEGVNLVSAYDEHSVTINGQVWRQSVLLPSHGDAQAWNAPSLAALTLAHFEQLAALEPELVIFGSGAKLQFAKPALLQPLMRRRIGIETMDTRAACRTYNILASEGRRAAAALLLIQE